MMNVGDAMSTLGFPILMKGFYPLAPLHKPLYSLDVLMISPHISHDIPPMFWTSFIALVTFLQCTHDIPPMYS